MAEEWLLGTGFGQTKAQKNETDTDGQQAGETEFHGESLQGGSGPGWKQSTTPGSAKGRSGRRVGVKLSTNVNGLGPKGVQSPLALTGDDEPLKATPG